MKTDGAHASPCAFAAPIEAARPPRRHPWAGILLMGFLACASSAPRTPEPEAPRLLELPPARGGLPAAPEEPGAPHCARAAFELPLGVTGAVVGRSLRILAWEENPRDPYALQRLQSRARASRWALPRGHPAQPTRADSIVAYALLRLDCRAPAVSPPEQDQAFEMRLHEALQVRRLAAQELSRRRGSHYSEYDLDCLWSELGTWRRGPFLHDAVEGWETLEPRLQAVQDRDGGFWVCRLARGSHQGEFLFLDGERRLLAVARYWLGE